jgi:hypothetical protein
MVKRRVRRKSYQTGRSVLKFDRRLLAKKPGRRGKGKKVYYEYRRNRSDVNRKSKL